MLAAHQPLAGETSLEARELESRLQQVRANGWWQGNSQHVAGVVDIAVPLLGPDGHAFAALTCPYVLRIDRHICPDVDQTRSLLLEAARGLSTGP
jgi:DNA-binding IclR family transcriptional regulator